VRTSGPWRPSGRRSASTIRAGSGPGSMSSRRSSAATACAASEASFSGRPGSGSCTQQHVGVAAVAALMPAEPAHRDHREPGRRRPAQLGGDLAQRTASAACSDARVDAGQRLPGSRQASGEAGGAEGSSQGGSGGMVPPGAGGGLGGIVPPGPVSTSAAEVRSSSRRRTERTAVTAASASSSYRWMAAVISHAARSGSGG